MKARHGSGLATALHGATQRDGMQRESRRRETRPSGRRKTEDWERETKTWRPGDHRRECQSEKSGRREPAERWEGEKKREREKRRRQEKRQELGEWPWAEGKKRRKKKEEEKGGRRGENGDGNGTDDGRNANGRRERTAARGEAAVRKVRGNCGKHKAGSRRHEGGGEMEKGDEKVRKSRRRGWDSQVNGRWKRGKKRR